MPAHPHARTPFPPWTAALLWLPLSLAWGPPLAAQHRGAGEHRDAPRYLEVAGSAEVSVETDQAMLTFAVETEATSAREAGAANARLMEAVRVALRQSGGPDARLETFGYGVEPLYRRESGVEGPPRIDGYRARNQMRITLAGVDAVGAVIDAALDAGANRVTGLAFQATDTREARLEALRLAVERARSEAAAMAAALGVELGPPLEVRGGSQVPSPRFAPGMEMVMARMDTATPVEAGLQSVTASVTVRYRLDD